MFAQPTSTATDTLVAAPCFGEEVAPLFEAASRFRLWRLRPSRGSNPAGKRTTFPGIEPDMEDISAPSGNGLERVRMIRALDVDVLLVNGIRPSQRAMLATTGCQVIDGVIGPLQAAFEQWRAGHLKRSMCDDRDQDPRSAASTTETQRPRLEPTEARGWITSLMEQHGWDVQPAEGGGMDPVDLIAEHDCPRCGRPVQVAICCGSHAWRIEDEVGEFHRLTSRGFHARVYVQGDTPHVRQLCDAFGIELLDPGREPDIRDGDLPHALPPLVGEIHGHEQLTSNHSRLPREPRSTQERA